MIYELTHTTTYDYVNSVSLSHHTLRLQPRDLTNQKCLQTRMQIQPGPAVVAISPRLFWKPGHVRHR